MRDELNGRVALVTGAGRGIGRAVAIGLAAQGAAVAVVARTAAQLDEVGERIEEAGGRAFALPLDVGDQAALGAAVTEVACRLGPVDVLVNNAAVVWPLGPTGQADLSLWSQALAINVIAPATLADATVPGMVARGWGRIVDVSSGIVANPGGMIGGNAYAASKAALEAHTLNLAAELRGTGVTVNVYRPGAVDTAMQAWIRDQDPDQIGHGLHDHFVASKDTGALITPEQSAAFLLARLASPETGAIWSYAEAA